MSHLLSHAVNSFVSLSRTAAKLVWLLWFHPNLHSMFTLRCTSFSSCLLELSVHDKRLSYFVLISPIQNSKKMVCKLGFWIEITWQPDDARMEMEELELTYQKTSLVLLRQLRRENQWRYLQVLRFASFVGFLFLLLLRFRLTCESLCCSVWFWYVILTCWWWLLLKRCCWFRL